MKKVLYSVALVAALGLAACGTKAEKPAEEAPAAEVENVEVPEVKCAEECTDSTACCKEGEECTNEECNKDGECTADCQKEEVKAEVAE